MTTRHTRAQFSQDRLHELREAMSDTIGTLELPGLTIFAAGSFARQEASQHSDIDLFFTYTGVDDDAQLTHQRTNEIRLFGRLIDKAEELGFPAFSRDAAFLKTHSLDQILLHLGSPVDDAENHFTLRMLLILESTWVYSQKGYESALEKIIESYFVDYPRHEENFEPWFLINDIMRYWKTLLLNYENSRSASGSSGSVRAGGVNDDAAKIRVKNFKLRFSRLTTCFATIAALASNQEVWSPSDVRELVIVPPMKRLELVRDQNEDLASLVEEIFSEYDWFLQMTSLPTQLLHDEFRNDVTKNAHTARAEHYGNLMYQLLQSVASKRPADKPDFMRRLVI